MFTLFDNILTDIVSGPVKYAFFFIGATLIGIDIARTYKRYKASLKP
jgi:hypothetical protein